MAQSPEGSTDQAKGFWKTTGLVAILVALIGLVGVIIQVRNSDGDESGLATAGSNPSPPPSTASNEYASTTSLASIDQSTDSVPVTLPSPRPIRVDPKLYLTPRSDLDLDTGSTVDRNTISRDGELGSNGFNFFRSTLSYDASLIQMDDTPAGYESCLQATRIMKTSVAVISIKVGTQYCVHTTDGNIALVRVVDKIEEERTLVFWSAVWKKGS